MRRLLFSRKKLNLQKRILLQQFLEDVSYTCGDNFSDYELPSGLEGICIKEHKCYDTIEKLLFFIDFEPTCFYCGTTKLPSSIPGDCYPQCEHCSSNPKVNKPQPKYLVFIFERSIFVLTVIYISHVYYDFHLISFIFQSTVKFTFLTV